MNTLSILIVEDEPIMLARLVKYVSLFCETIYEATNGVEALILYENHLPSIVLTDINMPKLRGVEFIEKIRQTGHNTQIIVLSAHTHTEDFLRVIPLNLVSYLVKPVQMELLKEAILKAIDTLSKHPLICLNNGYFWNSKTKTLLFENEVIELTSYENTFLESLISKLDKNVSYEELHNEIYDFDEYSQDAIFTIAKRLRKKTQKEFITSCFNFGYKMTSG
jgi:two-component system response regulator VanR